MPRRAPPSRSLGVHIFWLTGSIVLLVEALALLPFLGEARQIWLWNRAAAICLVLALLMASLAALATERLLLRPLRTLTADLAGFRRDPNRTGFASPKWLLARGDDEIGRAAVELIALQDALRAALGRNARLAALGASVGNIQHDLRNSLASALLVAARLENHGDPQVRQAAATLIPAIERAADLLSRGAYLAREEPPEP